MEAGLEDKTAAQNKWKFYVYMVDNAAMLTTYAQSEKEAASNVKSIVEENKNIGEQTLTGEKKDILFTVDSPFDLATMSDEQIQKLCVLVTHTIIANDNCNISLRQVLSEDRVMH